MRRTGAIFVGQPNAAEFALVQNGAEVGLAIFRRDRAFADELVGIEAQHFVRRRTANDAGEPFGNISDDAVRIHFPIPVRCDVGEIAEAALARLQASAKCELPFDKPRRQDRSHRPQKHSHDAQAEHDETRGGARGVTQMCRKPVFEKRELVVDAIDAIEQACARALVAAVPRNHPVKFFAFGSQSRDKPVAFLPVADRRRKGMPPRKQAEQFGHAGNIGGMIFALQETLPGGLQIDGIALQREARRMIAQRHRHRRKEVRVILRQCGIGVAVEAEHRDLFGFGVTPLARHIGPGAVDHLDGAPARGECHDEQEQEHAENDAIALQLLSRDIRQRLATIDVGRLTHAPGCSPRPGFETPVFACVA